MKRVYLLTASLLCLTVLFFSCQKETSFESPIKATGALQDDVTGDCLPKVVHGTFKPGTALTDSNYIDVGVLVLTPGTFTITTDTVNNYYFVGTGSFNAPGLSTVRLVGRGTPSVAGLDDFTVSFDSTVCNVSIVVTSANGCGTALGTYTAGAPLTASNTATAQHSYATAGTYTVGTDTVNGYYFNGTVTATAGTPTIINLNGSGTPLAAGTNTFTLKYGDSTTCTFTVTVTGSTTVGEYFYTTANSWWSYDNVPSPPDTLKTTVSGTGSFLGNTYQKFTSVYQNGPTTNDYYRKDVATGSFYRLFDTTGSGYAALGVMFAQRYYDILFLKNVLQNGDTWNNDITITYNSLPATLRLKFTCVSNNMTVTVNGNTFNNVYQISTQALAGIAGTFTPIGGTANAYYCKGIGLIKSSDNSGNPLLKIRNWQVF